MDSIRKWDLRLLSLSQQIAKWSKDPSTKVGAVIVDNNNRIVSTGYNGFPVGVLDSEDRYNNRDIKYEMVIHAETNALFFAQRNLNDCRIYISIGLPCSRCASNIVQNGIKKVICPTMDQAFKERWKNSMELSLKILDEGGVNITYYDLDNLNEEETILWNSLR